MLKVISATLLFLFFAFSAAFAAPSKITNASSPKTNALIQAKNGITNTNMVQSNAMKLPEEKKQQFVSCVDISGGIFLPLGELYGNMNLGADIGIHMKTPITRLVSKEVLGGSFGFFSHFDLGLGFGFIAGSSTLSSSNTIVFAPLLFDIYFNFPLYVNTLTVYVYNGIGISAASASVERSGGTLTRQSFDFTLRPGIGIDFYPVERFYLRLDLAYTAAFESIVGMGLSVTLGAGYVY